MPSRKRKPSRRPARIIRYRNLRGQFISKSAYRRLRVGYRRKARLKETARYDPGRRGYLTEPSLARVRKPTVGELLTRCRVLFEGEQFAFSLRDTTGPAIDAALARIPSGVVVVDAILFVQIWEDTEEGRLPVQEAELPFQFESPTDPEGFWSAYFEGLRAQVDERSRDPDSAIGEFLEETEYESVVLIIRRLEACW